jgi:shikimate kinase
MPSPGTTPRRRLICLTGFMGCGKTTVGQLLARHLAWRFVDLDARIEHRAGLRITEIFDRLGESAFREIEHEQLIEALGQSAELDQPTVLALGGGTFAQPQNIELLRASRLKEAPERSGTGSAVIWLDCPIEVLLKRCVTMADRPLFRDEASFRQLFEQRLPFYQQADFRVDSSGDPRRVVEQILTLGIVGGGVEPPDQPSGSPGSAHIRNSDAGRVKA